MLAAARMTRWELLAADLHWWVLTAIPPRLLSLFVVRGELDGRFPSDLIDRVEERMYEGRFLWSRCLPVPDSVWVRRRAEHPNARLFRASAERQRSELCVHAVDADFSSLKVVWIGMSHDATLVLYEVFFPSLGAFVLMVGATSLAGLAVWMFVWGSTMWQLGWLIVPLVLAQLVRHSRRATREELVRVLRDASR